MWGITTKSVTTGNMAWGILNGTVGQPSSAAPQAGIDFNVGDLNGINNCCDISFVWPGGGRFTPAALGSTLAGSAPAYIALDYDGTTVRGFINGQLVFTQATTTAAIPNAAPVGFMDESELATGYFDSFQVSTGARYTQAFTNPGGDLSPDSNTQILLNFDNYSVSKMKGLTLTPFAPYTPSYFGVWPDKSSHSNWAEFVAWTNPWEVGWYADSPMTWQPYELTDGVNPDTLVGGGTGYMCPCTLAATKYPVNTATGEFFHTFQDLSLPGRGIPIQLSRTYSSARAGQLGPFGYGWTDSYNAYLTFDQAGNVSLHEGTGSLETFVNQGGGSYLPPSHLWVSLTVNGGGNFVFTNKDGTRQVFNSTGQLTQLVDRNGYITALAYTSGQLTTVTDPAGRTVTFTYGTNGLVGTVADSANRSLSFGYDTNNNLTTVTDVNGGATTFTYYSGHLLWTMKDPLCNATGGCPGVVNVYDGSGRVTQQTDALGRVTSFAYWSQGPITVTTVTDPRQIQTVYEYANNVLLTLTEASGTPLQATTTYAFDPLTLGQVALTDPGGASTLGARDSRANQVASSNPLGRTATSTYNSFSQPLMVQDPSGVTTSYQYDSAGNLLSVSTPLVGTSSSRITTYTYGDTTHPGDVTQVTDSNGKPWLYTYDTYGNRASAIDPMYDRTTYQYDAASRLTSRVMPRGNVTGGTPSAYTWTYTYDPAGNLLTERDPTGGLTTNVYDGDHNRTSTTDANHHTTTYQYDLDSELTLTVRPDSSTAQTNYDADGNATQQIDALNHATVIAYDARNRKSSLADPLNRVASYSYDAAGHLTSATDSSGKTTGYSYDAAAELVAISYHSAQTPDVNYVYDANGRRVGMSDGTGASSYQYDSLSRLTQSVSGAGVSVGYAYDLVGRITTLTYPVVGQVLRSYDDAGRLASVQDWLGNKTTFSYDADSNLVGVAFANGVTETITVDAVARTSAISATKGGVQPLSLAYARDTLGQLTGDNALTYSYDPLNRLTGGTWGTYQYDGASRMTQLAPAGGNTTTLAYDNGDQLQTATVSSGGTQIGQTVYSYDLTGNRVSQTSSGTQTVLGWDQANRLSSYGTVQYAYNGDGLRTGKVVAGMQTAFTWDLGEGLPLLIQEAGTSYITGPGGQILEQVVGAGAYYYLTDQLGSVRSVTDSLGNVASTYEYDPYGNLAATTGTLSNPFRFAGQYLDAESGLYYLRARYYDPSCGQFVSRDPLAAATRQAYIYASDNPANRTDPTGLCDWWDLVCQVDVVHARVAAVSSNLELAAQVADAVSGVAAAVSIGCAVGGLAAAVTGVGFAIGETCAAFAGGLSLAATGIGLALHGLAAWGGNVDARSGVADDAFNIAMPFAIGRFARSVGPAGSRAWKMACDAIADRGSTIASRSIEQGG